MKHLIAPLAAACMVAAVATLA
ncbi:MAG: hypothetical protein JWP59_1683, partial [Massilia sp.]|nr:hypothetical protein [Massilia sp.]